MDGRTWRKEGLYRAWSWLKKSCCKVCCSDMHCEGCRECQCREGPIRGLYDGLVVLTCLTRHSLPSHCLAKMDQEDLAITLVQSLTMNSMQAEMTLVQTGRERFLPDIGGKKFPAYCVFMAYRLGRHSEVRSSVGAEQLWMRIGSRRMKA